MTDIKALVGDTFIPSWTIAGISTAFLAFLIHRIVQSSFSSQSSKPGHKSRLLENKFGSINDLDDLALHESRCPKEKSTRPGCKDKPLPNEETIAKEGTSFVSKNKPSSSSRTNKSSTTFAITQRQPPAPLPPTTQHPGLEKFLYWWDVETSLYRIYTVHRLDGKHPPPPYNPSSRRGNTKVALRVTNNSKKRDIKVYWINYKGGYEEKGIIHGKGGTWHQTTFIDHPWVFSDAETDEEVASYIPYKIIPSVSPDSITLEDGETTGVHRFSLEDAKDDDPFCCRIVDDFLPFHPSFRSTGDALELALLHCLRTGYFAWTTLLKYLENLEKGHRVIRIANSTFSDSVWNTAARGVLLALGFQEQGAYVQMPLRWTEQWRKTVLDVVRHYQNRFERGTSDTPQPDGADGFGRAGYGL